MCGLVALIAKRQAGFFSPDQDIFKQMLYADAVRGWDATGVFGVTKGGNIDVKKQAVAAVCAAVVLSTKSPVALR